MRVKPPQPPRTTPPRAHRAPGSKTLPGARSVAGRIKGRPDASWQFTLRDRIGPVGSLPALVGLGFDGIWIDTYGYVDNPDEVDQIVEAVGVEPLVSDDGRFLFLDLTDFARRTAMTDEELRQAAIDLLGVTPPEGTP